MIFIKILKNTIQIKNIFDDMIADMLSNKKLHSTVTKKTKHFSYFHHLILFCSSQRC